MKCPHCNKVIGFDIRVGDEFEILMEQMKDMSINSYIQEHMYDIKNKQIEIPKEK